ncbi:MAG: ATP-binding protein [Jiangellaceae bacterium]
MGDAASERSTVANSPDAHTPRKRRIRNWFGGRSVRMRIITSYVVLLAFSAIVSTFALTEILLLRLGDRIEADLDQEILELDRLLTDGRDPNTGQPFTSLPALYDVYFSRNVPSSGEGMLAFTRGELYGTSLERFPLPEIPAESMAAWEAYADGPEASDAGGVVTTAVGKAHYRVEAIRFGDESGAFVVVNLPVAELREIQDVRTYGLVTSLAVLVAATALAWPVAGRVLAPLRALTATARSISESDLTGRIEVRGSGEAAEMARAFNAMLDRLEELFRSQRKFVQDASHELRDPVTICRGHLELLTDDPVDQQATVALVVDELTRMGRIVDDLQVLADANQPDFVRLEAVDLGVLAHELVAKASALGDRQWTLDAAAEETVPADRYRLTEAVMNLAHNAVNSTRPGQTVAIGTAVTGEDWRIWVRDTGVGVGEEDRERIFDRFARGAESRRHYQGAGLGLAIVSLITKAHGGRVELQSQVGHGSTFTIVVPVDRTAGDLR